MSINDDPDHLRLQVQISSLHDELDTVRTYELSEVRESIETVQQQARALDERLELAESDLSDADSRLADLLSSMKLIKTSVTWLERHIRSSDAVEVADLDNVGPDLRTAARLAEAGAAAQTKLLPTHQRQMNESFVRWHNEALATRESAITTLLDTTGTLARLNWDSPEHPAARTAYTEAKQALKAVQNTLKTTGPRAEKAGTVLADDDTLRAELSPTITTGQKNATTLLTKLRTRVADAVLDGSLLPIWLHDLLGPMPPEGQTAQWVDVATQVLAYRITYQAQDPLIAIGKVPADASTRRKNWADTITRDVSRLRT